MTKINNLGKAKSNDRMFKRGYTVNLAPNAVNKPAAAPEPPASAASSVVKTKRSYPPTFQKRIGPSMRSIFSPTNFQAFTS
jgi:hypothetical protein